MNNILKSIILFKITVFVSISNSHAQDIFSLIEKDQTVKAAELITKDPDLANIINSDKDLPLHYAAYFGNLEITNLLVSKGVEISVQNEFEHTPLHYAVRNEFFEITEILLNAGANPNIKNYWGDTPIFYSVSSGNKKLIELLLKYGADLNVKNALGDSPLADAVLNQKSEMIEYLLQFGADIESKDMGGQTPVFKAMQKNNKDIAAILIKNGAKITVVDNDGLTLHHKMAVYGSNEMSAYLIDLGLNVNSEDNFGRTPIYYAAKYGHKNVYDLLKSNGAVEQKDMEYNFNFAPELKKNLRSNEAVIWYLGTSGWAVKTKNHLLILDYAEWEDPPDRRSLANGHINVDEIKDLDVIVFTTHLHSDHYNPLIFEWETKVKNIKYVFSWEDENTSKHICLTDSNSTVEVSGVQIHTINYFTDVPEVAYLVKADDLVIYSSGDYRGDFENDLVYFANIYGKTDIAFVLATGGKPDVSKRAVEILSPNAIFPTHALDGYEYLYAGFDGIIGSQYSQNIFYEKHKGDKFFFDGTIIKK